MAIHASYVVGFTEGKGCFLVCLRKDSRIDLRFFIAQAEGNRQLLQYIRDFLVSGASIKKALLGAKNCLLGFLR